MPPPSSSVEPQAESAARSQGARFPVQAQKWITRIQRKWAFRQIDPNSLQLRLTLGVALCSLLGLSSVTLWSQWKMQEMLISTHTQTLDYLIQRFPQDLISYSRNLSIEASLKKTVNHLSSGRTLIWVEKPTGDRVIPVGTQAIVSATVEVLNQSGAMPITPAVYQIQNYYFMICVQPVTVQEMMLGKVYFAQDITQEQRMLHTTTHSLVLLSGLIAGLTLLAIAIYIRRSLRPLYLISQRAALVRAEDLAHPLPVQPHAPTEVTELAETLNMMLARLSASLDQQRQFVSNVSHELRTPLTIVQGYLQSILRRSQNLSLPQREALETATAEAARIVRLLEVLLDLARADSGYMHYTLTAIDLQDFVTEVVGMTAQHSDRPILIEFLTPDMTVTADRDRLTQVMINLIDNAMKYSAMDQPVIIRVDRQSNLGCIHVIDQGIGIPLQQQSRIFERFYRVDPARSPETGGAGLGLSIVKTLVEGMGGQISVRSKPNQGSTFTIRLPLSAPL